MHFISVGSSFHIAYFRGFLALHVVMFLLDLEYF